jgi:hypothetical protein
MLSLLSTILQWNDIEREKAGLQRINKAKPKDKQVRRDSAKGEERSAEEEAAMNEVSPRLLSVAGCSSQILVVQQPLC